MPDRLFVYGTLLVPELRHALLGRTLDGSPAELPGYACFRVRHAAYPAITPAAGATTAGELVGGLSHVDFEKLDDYESALYRRLVVTVRDNSGNDVESFTYVIDNSAVNRLSDETWDYAAFRLRQLDRYLKAL
ncbi:MAG: gamma-glutamylcyclotransferase family protein [Gammaproteobacteria bacterium]